MRAKAKGTGNLVVDGGSAIGNTEDGFQELAGKLSRCRTQSSLQSNININICSIELK